MSDLNFKNRFEYYLRKRKEKLEKEVLRCANDACAPHLAAHAGGQIKMIDEVIQVLPDMMCPPFQNKND